LASKPETGLKNLYYGAVAPEVKSAILTEAKQDIGLTAGPVGSQHGL